MSGEQLDAENKRTLPPEDLGLSWRRRTTWMWVVRVTIYIAAVCTVTLCTVGCYPSRNKCDQRNERKKSSETLHENVRMCVWYWEAKANGMKKSYTLQQLLYQKRSVWNFKFSWFLIDNRDFLLRLVEFWITTAESFQKLQRRSLAPALSSTCEGQ